MLGNEILAALIAAVISLVVTIGTLWFNRRKLDSEEKRHKFDHKRRVAEKRLDLRLSAYPHGVLHHTQAYGSVRT